VGTKLLEIYQILFDHFGPRNWWPADSAFEMIVGALLTQNTAWKNVEKAIMNLKHLGPITPEGLKRLPPSKLKDAIRPAGYYNQKTKRLQNIIEVLFKYYEGDLDLLFALPTETLRERLLAVSGIGPETADSILLYGAERPVFVIDTYTIRILSRHGLIAEEVSYAEAQEWIMDNLPFEVPLFNEFHALFVALGKEYCRPKPKCEGCPLENFS